MAMVETGGLGDAGAGDSGDKSNARSKEAVEEDTAGMDGAYIRVEDIPDVKDTVEMLLERERANKRSEDRWLLP